MDRPFLRLEMWSFGQMSEVDSSRLLCKQLMFSCSGDDPEWIIDELLMMPHSQAIEATLDHKSSPGTPLKMYGSHASHQALLQHVCLKLDYPFELQLSSPVATIPLRKSGHALVCVCSACLSKDS